MLLTLTHPSHMEDVASTRVIFTVVTERNGVFETRYLKLVLQSLELLTGPNVEGIYL